MSDSLQGPHKDAKSTLISKAQKPGVFFGSLHLQHASFVTLIFGNLMPSSALQLLKLQPAISLILSNEAGNKSEKHRYHKQ